MADPKPPAHVGYNSNHFPHSTLEELNAGTGFDTPRLRRLPSLARNAARSTIFGPMVRDYVIEGAAKEYARHPRSVTRDRAILDTVMGILAAPEIERPVIQMELAREAACWGRES